MILRRGNIKRYYTKEKGSRVPKRSAWHDRIRSLTTIYQRPYSRALCSALLEHPTPRWVLGTQQCPCASPHLSLPSPSQL